jgi:hypothetical protein
LLERARAAGNTSGKELEQLVIDAIGASGAAAVRSAGLDRGFDIGVWADELDSIGANPLLTEVKQRMSEGAVRQSLLALHSTPSARLALTVYVAADDLSRYADLRNPLLAIQLETLLERCKTEASPRSFAIYATEAFTDFRCRARYRSSPGPRAVSRGDQATNNTARDRALEGLVIYIFSLVPGLGLVARNAVNAFTAEEIDVPSGTTASRTD